MDLSVTFSLRVGWKHPLETGHEDPFSPHSPAPHPQAMISYCEAANDCWADCTFDTNENPSKRTGQILGLCQVLCNKA